jgi:hypothetical protein
MKRFEKRSPIGSALVATILAMGALLGSRPAAAHCGEHADSCGPSVWQEIDGGYCTDAAAPFDYGTWWQPYEVSATWCNVPVRCFPASCAAEPVCGAGSTCIDVNGTCSCPPGKLAPCASCAGACEYAKTLPFDHDSRCWPWGIENEVPCAGPWKNHGKYVSALAHLLNDALSDGLITDAQHDALMDAGSESSCGR